ncbi:MAG: DUF2461 domain-containing protein [Lawsonibacter sp.]|nr:DUF2461 domain-containing protein [Lawsonibacter sp.]
MGEDNSFQGYSQGTVDFLWDLRFHNERSWFQAHKEEFIALVDTPTRTLSAQLAREMTAAFPKLGLEPKVSRIYRDARRLFGRGPYKDHLWFSLRKPGEHDGSIPCFWFEVAPDRYGYGMGCWDMPPVTMAKLRARIDRDPKPVERLARAVNRRGEFVLDGELYKRPKGDPGKLLFPWYNCRQFSLSCLRNCEGVFFTPELAGLVLEGWRSLVPVYRWLCSLPGDPPPEEQ